MAPPRQPQSISAFMLGAAVPKEFVGDVLEQLYLRGLEGSLQCQPIYDRPQAKKLEVQIPPSLPAPPQKNGHDTQGLHRRPAGMSIPEFIYRVIEREQPISRSALAARGKAAGMGTNTMTTNLGRMKKQKWITVDKNNVYTLGTGVPKFFPAPYRPKIGAKRGTSMEAAPNTQEGVLLAHFRTAQGPITTSAAAEFFRQKGFRANSASVAIMALQVKGFIKRIDKATYQYVS